MKKVLDSGGAAAAAPGAERRLAFAALHHRDFRIYFTVSMLSMMADNIEHVISYWLLFQKFHSPVLGGFAVISHWTPFLLFSVYFGALADRHDCRKVIQASQLMYAVVSLAWGVLFFTDTIEVWHACVLLVVHGMAGVLWGPGSQLIIHDIVGREFLQSAVRLNSTSRQLGILLGPAVGGGMMLLFGPAVGLFVNVILYLPLAAWLATVPYTGHRRDEAGGGRTQRLTLRGAVALLRELSADRTILSMIVLGGATSLLVGNAFQAQMPEFAHDFGHDKQDIAYSVLLGANAAGAVVGGLLLEGRGLLRPDPRTAVACAILWCLAIAGFAASSSYLLGVALLFCAGLLNLTFLSMAQTLVQLLAPAQLRGRLIGLFNMSYNGLKAFSGVTVGVVGGLIGVHWSLGLSAMALLAVIIALFAFMTPERGAAGPR
ncbi:MAG TPA: MFS transporter [candidate division Zixibacteria bacterium]|nr:MFS transporter [candidate division Zixibacteria bacterium]